MDKIDEKYFFDGYRLVFNERITNNQVLGMLNIIRHANESPYVERISHYAFLLGNSKLESNNTFLSVPEGYWIKPEERRIRAITAYYSTGKGRNHRRTIVYDDGRLFCGRGAISQTTHDYNYKNASQKIYGDDRLFENPDLLLVPEVDILVAIRGCAEGWFTGLKMNDFMNDSKVDFYHARKIINGLNKAGVIAGYCNKFQSILRFE